jgi:signal transduction histidine kinase
LGKSGSDDPVDVAGPEEAEMSGSDQDRSAAASGSGASRSTNVEPATTTHPWSPFLIALPYLLLIVLALVSVAARHHLQGPLALILALSAALAAWTWWMVTLHPAWREHPRRMAVYFTGLVAGTAVLIAVAPWFGLLTPALYVYSFRLVAWPQRLLAVGATGVLAGTAQAHDVDRTTLVGLGIYLVVVAANVLPICGYAWLDHRTDEQAAARDRNLAEIREAHRRLEATMAENAELQEQLLAQAREAGVHGERQRMAREIHDTLAQGLTGIVAQLQAAEQAEDDAAAWRRHIAAAIGLARESLTEARRSVHELRPEPLATARLGEALAEVAGRWERLHGVPVAVTTTGTVRALTTQTEVALLRTAQEALANVAKHAGATRVGVTLSYLGDQVALDVRDDGRGFDPAAAAARSTPDGAAPDGGFGLVAMRQRIEALAGTLQIESEPGYGTGLSACVPLTPAEAAP